MGLVPGGEGAEGHDGDDDIGDDAGRGFGDEVECDPAERGEGGENEAVLFVDAEAVHREEHKDGGCPIESKVCIEGEEVEY